MGPGRRMWHPVGGSALWRGLTFLSCCAPVFENSSKIVIVMEYASRGDLYDYIIERQRLSEREARHFFRQIVSAVHYCHQVSSHLPGPGLRGWPLGLRGWFAPERFHDSSRITQGDRAEARLRSGLSPGHVGVSSFASLDRGWKDSQFVI